MAQKLKVCPVSTAEPLIQVHRMEAARNGEPFGRCIDLCTAITVGRYLYAPNADVILERKTHQVVRINLYAHGDDSRLHSFSGSPATTYTEQVSEEHSLVVVKKLNRHGALVKWSDKDSFTPGRFNPDRIRPLRKGLGDGLDEARAA